MNFSNNTDLEFPLGKTLLEVKVIFARCVCYLVCLWTIGVHGLLLVCFFLNRRAVWIRQAVGIISLTFTDFLSGWNLLLLLTIQKQAATDSLSCLIVSGSYLSTHFMTSLQILNLCVKRLLSVLAKNRRPTETVKEVCVKYIIMYVTACTLIALSCVWVQWGHSHYAPCILQTVFGENLNKVSLFMFTVIALPNVITSLIYGCILVKIKSKRQNIQPVLDAQNDTPNQTGNANMAARKYFKRALITIGLILLLNNIAITPYSVILSLQANTSDVDKYPAQFWIASALFLQTNSAFSPFVYGFRIKAIQQAFKDMLLCRTPIS